MGQAAFGAQAADFVQAGGGRALNVVNDLAIETRALLELQIVGRAPCRGPVGVTGGRCGHVIPLFLSVNLAVRQ